MKTDSYKAWLRKYPFDERVSTTAADLRFLLLGILSEVDPSAPSPRALEQRKQLELLLGPDNVKRLVVYLDFLSETGDRMRTRRQHRRKKP